MNPRAAWSVLTWLGAALVLAGALTALLGDVEVVRDHVAVDLPYATVEYMPPGNYTRVKAVQANYTRLKVQLAGAPVEAVLELPPPPGECLEVVRCLGLAAEGVVGSGTLEVWLYGLVHGAWRRLTNFTVQVPQLTPGKPTFKQSIILAPNATILVWGHLEGSEVKVSMESKGAIKVPVAVEAVKVVLKPQLRGRLWLRLMVTDHCTIRYVLEQPVMKSGVATDRVYLPYVDRVDVTPLRAALALIGIGNSLALLGLYGLVSSQPER